MLAYLSLRHINCDLSPSFSKREILEPLVQGSQLLSHHCQVGNVWDGKNNHVVQIFHPDC